MIADSVASIFADMPASDPMDWDEIAVQCDLETARRILDAKPYVPKKKRAPRAKKVVVPSRPAVVTCPILLLAMCEEAKLELEAAAAAAPPVKAKVKRALRAKKGSSASSSSSDASSIALRKGGKKLECASGKRSPVVRKQRPYQEPAGPYIPDRVEYEACVTKRVREWVEDAGDSCNTLGNMLENVHKVMWRTSMWTRPSEYDIDTVLTRYYERLQSMTQRKVDAASGSLDAIAAAQIHARMAHAHARHMALYNTQIQL